MTMRYVIAVGVKTDHWKVLCNIYPWIRMCTVQVADALKKERHESSAGTGLDTAVALQIMAKEHYPLLKEIVLSVLDMYGMVFVACNWGIHRSLVLAKDAALTRGVGWLAPCCRRATDRESRFYESPGNFVSHIADHLESLSSTIMNLGAYPVSHLCVCHGRWDGKQWAQQNEQNPEEYHELREGDWIVVWDNREKDASGWVQATVVRGSAAVRGQWLPPEWLTSDSWLLHSIRGT